MVRVQSPFRAPYGGCSTMEGRKVVALETADRNRSVTPIKKKVGIFMDKVKKEIREYFKIAMKIELEDSPQILDDYLYIEFDNYAISDMKFRIPYPIDKEAFLEMNKADRMLFILTAIMRAKFGE